MGLLCKLLGRTNQPCHINTHRKKIPFLILIMFSFFRESIVVSATGKFYICGKLWFSFNSSILCQYIYLQINLFNVEYPFHVQHLTFLHLKIFNYGFNYGQLIYSNILKLSKERMLLEFIFCNVSNKQHHLIW